MNKELIELLTENLPDMLWIKDLYGNYMYVNQSMCDGLLMAENTQEPIGKNDIFFALREREKHKDISDWHTFGELCFNSDQIVLDNKKAMKFEEYGNIQGKMLYLEVYKAPFYDQDGNIIGTVGAGRDITELKKIEIELKKSLDIVAAQKKELKKFNAELEKRVQEEVEKQQNQETLMLHQSRQAAMGELIESIAHQWRQPLNVIGLATANLETQYTFGTLTKEDFAEKMAIVSSNIEYMSDTIDTFRNFLSLNKETVAFSVGTSIQSVLTILKAQFRFHHIIDSLEIDCSSFAIGDENEFKQVLFILFSNAIYAITTQHKLGKIKEGRIKIFVSCDKECINIDVNDNGGGIAEEIIGSIFEPYFTTKGKVNGTGIGLYIAKKIIESRMDGQLLVHNTKNGACFRIKIPFASKE